jgi:hypothetical protein
VEKGGEYLLQIKANQPTLLQQAQAAGAVSAPFCPDRQWTRAARRAPRKPLGGRTDGGGVSLRPQHSHRAGPAHGD